MKKIIIMALVFVLAFGGCVSTEPQIDPNLVTMKITEYSGEKTGFEIKNNSKDRVTFGEDYSLEFFNGEDWEEISEREETFFIAIAHVLETGDAFVSSVNLSARYGELSNGKYRIAKDIRFENEDGVDCGGQRVYAEFEVTAKER